VPGTPISGLPFEFAGQDSTDVEYLAHGTTSRGSTRLEPGITTSFDINIQPACGSLPTTPPESTQQTPVIAPRLTSAATRQNRAELFKETYL
jgi:hypothetical protein